jgi:Fe-S cluster assembly scaffold protein SufB
MNLIKKNLLEKVADLHAVPDGAYNLRENGKSSGRKSTDSIKIVNKEDAPGIVVTVVDGTVGKSVHIPVVITETGINETVYNDFLVGDGCDVLIVAGCGIHNSGEEKSAHDGVHYLKIGKGSKVKYVEKHYAEGTGGGKSMKPKMKVELGEGSTLDIETVQLGGVSDSERDTVIDVSEGASLVITERIMTSGVETVDSRTTVNLNGKDSSARINSRSVARDDSVQIFYPAINGNAECFGHVQCDSIIMDRAKVRSIPEICANDVDAKLIHEAAIGKIAGDQILKLQTLGLTAEEAEERILAGLLK